jgi:tetratricopeptide (TPR) repeat protein
MTILHSIRGIPNHSDRQLWAPLLLLTAVTVLVYAVSFFNGFVRDDEVIIVNNPQTLSLHNVSDVLFAPDVIKPYYRPLNRATYLLDYRIAGMNPAWYHGINIAIHAGNVLLLYLVCRRLFSDRTAAFIAALLFAVHPANSEAVNFISARNTILALFFSLASLLTFIKAKDQGTRWPLFSAALFLCGLLSKETAFMLIAMIALYIVIPLPGEEKREQGRGRYAILLPYLLALVVYFIMRAYSLHGLVGADIPATGLFERLYQNATIIPQYLLLLLFPVDLTIYHAADPRTGFLALPGAVLGVWIAMLAGLWLLYRKGSKATFFGLAWCVVNYAPISNIIPIPADAITERFLYLPAAGFFIMIGSMLNGLAFQKRWKYQYWTAVAAVLVAFAILTVQRSLDWKDEITLNTSGVMNSPLSATAHYNLGTALRDRGDLAGAAHEWRRALELDPTNSDSLIQMGTLYAMQGDLATAEAYYRAALRAPQGIADADKSMAYFNLGKIREKQGQPQKALEYYETFLKLVPMQYDEYKTDVERRIEQIRIDAARERIR